MRRHKLLVVGAAAGGGLSLVAVLGAALGWWWLVVLAAMLLATAVLVAALDTDRRVRELRSFVKAQVAAIDTTGGRAAPAQEDVVGTVRALQAQYTGRLDRLQDTLEATLESRGATIRQRDERG